MDHTALLRSTSVVDLERGGATLILEGDGDGDSLASSAPKFKKNLGRLRSGSLSFSGSISSGNGLLLSEDTWSSGENLDILVDERDEGTAISAKNEMVREKGKARNSKKPPKPPLPPKCPSLGAADMKLIRELSELAQLRHARIERMKALKNKKAKKAPSSTSPIFAMVVTVLFLCVIIFQGNLRVAYVGWFDFPCRLFSRIRPASGLVKISSSKRNVETRSRRIFLGAAGFCDSSAHLLSSDPDF